MEQKKIDRINVLAKKSRESGLTDEEKIEQAELRKEYIASFKASLTSQLDNTYILDKNNKKHKLERKKK